MKSYLLIVYFACNLAIPTVVQRKPRKLNTNEKLPLNHIHKKIDLLHEDVIKCIDEGFAALYPDKPQDILQRCVGDDFKVLKSFYQDVIQEIKDMMRNKLKFIIEDDFCKEYMESCMYFYNVLVIFTDKDFDLQMSVEFNKLYLEKEINKEVLHNLVEMTTDDMRNFDDIRKKIMEEYKFLKGYFADKFNEFKNKRLNDNYISNEEERVKIRFEIEEAKRIKLEEKRANSKTNLVIPHSEDNTI